MTTLAVSAIATFMHIICRVAGITAAPGEIPEVIHAMAILTGNSLMAAA